MKIKNILTACLVCCGFAVAFTSCSKDDEPYFSANENDAPRILNTDIPEGKGGEPGEIANIERTTNFKFEVIATPVNYTTVTWYLDDQLIYEGNEIDMPLLAGNHTLKIVATTTKGLSTYRICKLVVRPAEGEYPLTIEDAAGTRWECGMCTVSNDAYVDPGIKETVLREGGVDINWGDANVFLSAEEMANVPVGATVRLVYEMIDAEYHALRVTNQDWSSDIVPQVDGLDAIPSPYEFTYTADHKAIADEKGMLVTGFGYKLTKVTF